MFVWNRQSTILSVLFVVGAASGAMGVDKPATPQQTCVTADCHAEYAKRPHVHKPIELGDCKSCHLAVDPSEHTYKLARQGRDLCESCHLDKAARRHVHEPLKTGDCMQCHDPHGSESKFLIPEKTVQGLCGRCHDRIGKAPLLHGPAALGECSLCHNSHSSDHEKLLTVAPGELCVSCHVVTKDEIERMAFPHEPAKGDCIGCHDPHSVDDRQLLRAHSPEMCYPCHEEIKTRAETSKHKHSVVTAEGGCLKCHTPHASTVRFILKDDPATLCLECHNKPIGVGTDEVIGSFAEEIQDKKSLHGPIRDKDCSGCHVTHGSEHFRLLAKEYPPVFYAPFAETNYDLCFSCHPSTLVLTAATTDLTDFRNGDVNLHFLHVNKKRRGRTCRACHETHASNQPKHIRESVPYGAWSLPIGFTKTDTGGSCTPGCHVPFAYDREVPVDYSDR